nr:hypothetical protein [uncultured Campylobacter sp.]
MREICEDFCARLDEPAVNFGYKYVKSRREIYKNRTFSCAAKTFGEFISAI